MRAITQSTKCTLAGGCDRPGSPNIGEDLGSLAGIAPLGLPLAGDASALCPSADVIVDYSPASATMGILATAISHGKPVVVGTTGFDAAQHARPTKAGDQIPIMLAANMSVSVLAMYKLVSLASHCWATSSTSKSSIFTHEARSTRRPARPSNWASMRRLLGARRCPS